MKTNEKPLSGKAGDYGFLSRLDWSQVLAGLIVGTILGIGGTIFTLNGKMERMDEKIRNLQEQKTLSSQDSNSRLRKEQDSKADPNQLRDLIKKQQMKYVRKSNNEFDCFPETELATFIELNKPGQIVTELMNQNSFIDIIISIQAMTPVDRQDLLESCRNISKPTWREQGAINSNGQTEAGQKAELLIAGEIVKKIEEMIKLPLDEIKGHYK